MKREERIKINQSFMLKMEKIIDTKRSKDSSRNFCNWKRNPLIIREAIFFTSITNKAQIVTQKFEIPNSKN